MPLLFKWHKLMSTDWIWEQWDNDSVTNFPVTFLLLCVSAGGFSRRRTSMWRRAAPPAWWPMRIYRSSPYQVKQLSIFRCFMWTNWVSLLQLWEETGSIVILLSQHTICTITGETRPVHTVGLMSSGPGQIKKSSACVLLPSFAVSADFHEATAGAALQEPFDGFSAAFNVQTSDQWQLVNIRLHFQQFGTFPGRDILM